MAGLPALLLLLLLLLLPFLSLGSFLKRFASLFLVAGDKVALACSLAFRLAGTEAAGLLPGSGCSGEVILLLFLIVPESMSTSMLLVDEVVVLVLLEGVVVCGGTGEGEMVTPSSSSSVEMVELQSEPTVRLDSGRPEEIEY